MQWISIKDQLPDKEGFYLVHVYNEPVYNPNDEGNYYIDYFHYYNGKFYIRSECCREEEPLDTQGSYPLYWMSLPKPPKIDSINHIIDKYYPVLKKLSEN